MPSKKVVKKAPAAAPKKKAVKPSPLFASTPRNFRVGGDIRHKTDLSRFVRWPRYIRLQRQRKILKQRLKVPPALNQFSKALDKNQATDLFKLLVKYKPESKAEKKDRLKNAAVDKTQKKDASTAPPPVLKYGLNHITYLVENKKAKLVVIAHDVDPVELVVWLPALCRKMGVPYCIVKGKARLGTLVHKKNATAVALTAVTKEDKSKLETLASNFKAQYNDSIDRKWGGGVMGLKTQRRLEKREKALALEAAKKAQY